VRSGGQPEMGPHTHTESTLGTTSFLAICTKTTLTTGTSCFFYREGCVVVVAANQLKLHPSICFLLARVFAWRGVRQQPFQLLLPTL
jgi:hypothetical protein